MERKLMDRTPTRRWCIVWAAALSFPAVALLAWLVWQPVSMRSDVAIAALLDAPGLTFGGAADAAIQALGPGALFGSTCGNRTAITTNRRVAGGDWHVMAITEEDLVTEVELISLGQMADANCQARLETLDRFLTTQSTSTVRRDPDVRRHGFVQSTFRHYQLVDGTAVVLEHRLWVGDGSCDLTVRFAPRP